MKLQVYVIHQFLWKIWKNERIRYKFQYSIEYFVKFWQLIMKNHIRAFFGMYLQVKRPLIKKKINQKSGLKPITIIYKSQKKKSWTAGLLKKRFAFQLCLKN